MAKADLHPALSPDQLVAQITALYRQLTGTEHRRSRETDAPLERQIRTLAARHWWVTRRIVITDAPRRRIDD